MLLNGLWQAGINRRYDRDARVPGLVTDPREVTPGDLWYKRDVTLPQGAWSKATLVLNGARFRPRVFVNGTPVSAAEGGMTRTRHVLQHDAVKPGATITIEIALASLSDVPVGDASRIPPADHWRSNISSCLWDDVRIEFGERRPIAPPKRKFGIRGKHFELDGQPIRLRAGSVVWHRWCRDPEAGPTGLAWDESWFEQNILLSLKSLGANTIRFHLGMPPERFLRLCDNHGMLVQAEWSFFHNMDGTRESLVEQWRNWLDLCSEHESVVLIHAYNEYEGPETALALEVINQLAAEYPHFVFSYKDVMHPHKYWWSLFENVGCYYDSVEEFPQPIMVDEFGGNYLDGRGEPGGYPTVRESMLRFLGRHHTLDQRLQLQCESWSRVAEYWRRLDGGGAAGFSPFPMLASPADGNHLFMGSLREAQPKPVWASLAACYSPISASLDLWDRNFEPGTDCAWRIMLSNETGGRVLVSGRVGVQQRLAPPGVQVPAPEAGTRISADVGSFASRDVIVRVTVPCQPGAYDAFAVTDSPVAGVTHAIISSWRINVVEPKLLTALSMAKVHVPDYDIGLAEALRTAGVSLADADAAHVIATSICTWQRLAAGEDALREWLASHLQRGKHVVMLDVGPRPLGEGYPDPDIVRNLQGQPRVAEKVEQFELFAGLKLVSRRLPEPESCIHPSEDASSNDLWFNLPREATQLWNGLRGGLIVPASDLELIGLSPAAFESAWQSRGADIAALRAGNYFAYELAGYFEFSTGESDAAVKRLKSRVKFLVDDAPALAMAINPNAPVRTHGLSEMLAASATGQAQRVVPLVNAGKNLTRVPVLRVEFDPGHGRLIVSQLLTANRINRGFAEPGAYGLRYDPAALQFTLNMIAAALR